MSNWNFDSPEDNARATAENKTCHLENANLDLVQFKKINFFLRIEKRITALLEQRWWYLCLVRKIGAVMKLYFFVLCEFRI